MGGVCASSADVGEVDGQLPATPVQVGFSAYRKSAKPVKVGDKIPAITVDLGFNPITKVNIADRIKGKKVPGYKAKEAELKAKGVDEVIVFCVNDGAVMKAWAADQKISGTMITFLADTRGELTNALGMFIDHAGPRGDLGSARCKRIALVCQDGEVKNMLISEAPDDPAGDNDAKSPIAAKTMVEAVLPLL